MDRRNDERYSLLFMAKVTLLDQPERERDYLLSEVSCTGMKLIGQELLPTGKLIGVELDKHLLLAEVRYSYMRGTSALAGAMNLALAPKSDLSSSGARAARYAELEKEFQRLGPAPLPDDLSTVFPALAKKDANPVSSGPTISAAAVLNSIFEAQRDQMDYGEPIILHEGVESKTEEERETVLALAETPPVETQPFPDEAGALTEPPALENPLSPNEAMFLPPAPTKSRRGRIVLISGLAAAVALGVYMFQPKTESAKPVVIQEVEPRDAGNSTPVPTETAPATSGQASIQPKEPPVVQKQPEVPAPTPVQSNKPIPAGMHEAVLRVTAENWVSACSDGKPVFVKLLAAGEERTFSFKERMVLRTGNAGSAHIDVNGRYVGEVGPSGGVRLIELTPSGFRLLNSRTPVRDCDVQ